MPTAKRAFILLSSSAARGIQSTQSMVDAGLEIFQVPNAGLFLWAKLPIRPEESIAVTNDALSKRIWLAPGSYFRPGEPASEWFRFNAATSDVPELWTFMKGLTGSAG
jgi:DNA-binding transcriptional MocR family regulator